MTLYNQPTIVQQMADIELMQLDRSTAEQEMDQMVANSELGKMLDSLTQQRRQIQETMYAEEEEKRELQH